MEQIVRGTLFAVVVWYHPTERQKNNILSYQNAVREVIIIDNTQDNRGVAGALNRGIEQAISKGAGYILTMDQDSSFLQGDIDRYIQLCNECPIPNVGIFAPVHTDVSHLHLPVYQEPQAAMMTSGSIFSVDTYRTLGRLREDFFIDLIDDEYCARAKRYGYRLVTVNDIMLQHQLGLGMQYNPFFRKQYLNHIPWRYYYMIRNRLEVIRLYPELASYHKKQLHKFVKRLVLYDTHHKCRKLGYAIQGWWDYCRHRFGKRVPK